MKTLSSLIGTFLVCLSMIDNIYGLSFIAKATIGSIALCCTVVPLIINIVVLMNSPFSKLRYIADGVIQIILSDQYDRWNKERSLKGKGIYCNQSLLKCSRLPRCRVLTPEKIVYNGENHFSDFFSLYDFEIWDENGTKECLNISVGNGFSLLSPSSLPSSGKYWVVNRRINELRVILKYNVGSDSLMMLYYDGIDPIEWSVNLTEDEFIRASFIIDWHSKNPELGLTKFVGTTGKYFNLHSLPYQEVIKMIKSGCELYLYDLGNVVVEGEDIRSVVDLAFELLPSKFLTKFGFENSKIILEHNKLYWGDFNNTALKFICDRTNAYMYRIIGNNWKSKRYLVDVSYFLELSGNTRFSFLDKTIRPTKLAISLGKDITPHRNGEIIFNKTKREEQNGTISEIKELELRIRSETDKQKKKELISEVILKKARVKSGRRAEISNKSNNIKELKNAKKERREPNVDGEFDYKILYSTSDYVSKVKLKDKLDTPYHLRDTEKIDMSLEKKVFMSESKKDLYKSLEKDRVDVEAKINKVVKNPSYKEMLLRSLKEADDINRDILTKDKVIKNSDYFNNLKRIDDDSWTYKMKIWKCYKNKGDKIKECVIPVNPFKTRQHRIINSIVSKEFSRARKHEIKKYKRYGKIKKVHKDKPIELKNSFEVLISLSPDAKSENGNVLITDEAKKYKILDKKRWKINKNIVQSRMRKKMRKLEDEYYRVTEKPIVKPSKKRHCPWTAMKPAPRSPFGLEDFMKRPYEQVEGERRLKKRRVSNENRVPKSVATFRLRKNHKDELRKVIEKHKLEKVKLNEFVKNYLARRPKIDLILRRFDSEILEF